MFQSVTPVGFHVPRGFPRSPCPTRLRAFSVERSVSAELPFWSDSGLDPLLDFVLLQGSSPHNRDEATVAARSPVRRRVPLLRRDSSSSYELSLLSDGSEASSVPFAHDALSTSRPRSRVPSPLTRRRSDGSTRTSRRGCCRSVSAFPPPKRWFREDFPMAFAPVPSPLSRRRSDGSARTSRWRSLPFRLRIPAAEAVVQRGLLGGAHRRSVSAFPPPKRWFCEDFPKACSRSVSALPPPKRWFCEDFPVACVRSVVRAARGRSLG
jgi:hypothetical protein